MIYEVRMITLRDTQVIDFLTQFKIASASSIERLFYPSRRIAQRKLTNLVNEKQIARIRNSVVNEYLYFVKKLPPQTRHNLLITEFYSQLVKRYGKVKFKREPEYGSIRPDALFGYEINGFGRIGILEVEISNKGFDWKKYENFYKNEVKNFWVVPPMLIIISDTITNDIKLKEKGIETIIIKTDMSNFRLP